MPDGDIVHPKLPARYWGAYKQVCGPDFDPEATAHDIANPLKKSIQKGGDAPISMIHEAIAALSQLPREPLLKRGIEYGQVSRYIDQLAQKYVGDHSFVEMAKQSLKRQVDDFRHGDSEFSVTEAIKVYFLRIYEAHVVHRIPLTEKHLNEMDSETVNERVRAMQPYIEQELSQYARSAADQMSVEKMRRRNYRRPRAGLYTSAY